MRGPMGIHVYSPDIHGDQTIKAGGAQISVQLHRRGLTVRTAHRAVPIGQIIRVLHSQDDRVAESDIVLPKILPTRMRVRSRMAGRIVGAGAKVTWICRPLGTHPTPYAEPLLGLLTDRL